jgi:hypothetical protein
MMWLLPTAPPFADSKLSIVSVFLCVAGEGREGVGGAKSYDREKAWSFINLVNTVLMDFTIYEALRGHYVYVMYNPIRIMELWAV